MRWILVSLVAFLIAATPSAPTNVKVMPWAGILAPSHGIDWTAPGVTGGIPTNRANCVTTACNTLYGGTVTAATINAALASAPNNTVVRIPAGTFTVGGIDFAGRSNVTLRGAGADQTILNSNDTISCVGAWAPICMNTSSDLSWYGPGPPAHTATWSAGYAKGSTVVTLSSVTSLSAGMYIWLDQADDAYPSGDTGGFLVCSTGAGCTDQGGTINGRTGRGNRQAVKVVAISGSGPYQVTITPGVYSPNIVGSKNPGAWWGNLSGWSSYNGVEDLSINTNNAGGMTGAIACYFCSDSWVKGVRILYMPAPKSGIALYTAVRITVRDSYLYGSPDDGAGGSTHYGVETYGTSDCLIENNIVQHRASPFVRDGDQGSVYGYNFTIDDRYVPTAWFQASNYSHEAGNAYILDEGNVAVGLKGDIIHGPSNMWTFFRNQSLGWESGKTSETGAVKVYARNRYWSFIGNVLGTSAYHSAYEADSNMSIWAFGMGYNSAPSDSRVLPTSLRWWNWDTVTSSADNTNGDQTGTRKVASEVPSSDAFYPNPVPTVTNLPASFYLSAKPAWFGSITWPPIGPDVSGGNVANVGGHVHKLPAQVCWENATNDPAFSTDSSGYRIKVFTPNACYGTTGRN